MDSADIPTSSPSGSPNDHSCYYYFGYRVDNLMLVLAPISILCCLITILAITIPLFNKEERNKMSAYNLYLVYLAIPDLIMCIAYIVDITTCGLEVRSVAGLIVLASFLADIMVNTVILYEVLKLLVDSKTRRRSTPPSLFKASMQALAVYSVSIISLVVTSYFFDVAIIGAVIYGCAYAHLSWVLFRICYGRLLCYNSDTLNRLKVLVIYFARIIGLNMVTGITSIVWFSSRFQFFSVWLMIQIWIGFGLSLTKPDVLEYIRRLFAGVVRPCSKIGSSLGKNRDPTPTESEPSRHPETGDQNRSGDYDEGDKHEDGSVHIKEETEDCDRQENAEATTTSAK